MKMFRLKAPTLVSIDDLALHYGANVFCWLVARALCRRWGVDRASSLSDRIVYHVQMFQRNGGYK